MAGVSAGHPGMPLETNLFPLSLAHFGDTAVFFKQVVARTSPLHLSLRAVISANNKRRLFLGVFSPQPQCSALAMFPLEPFLIQVNFGSAFHALSRTEITWVLLQVPFEASHNMTEASEITFSQACWR